jgi:hypothetical protein
VYFIKCILLDYSTQSYLKQKVRVRYCIINIAIVSTVLLNIFATKFVRLFETSLREN